MFDTIEPQEQVTSIPFGRAAHVLQCAGFLIFIFGVIFRFANGFTPIACLVLFFYFLMGFRQKCHFYNDRVKFKHTASQPIIAPYSEIQDISLNKKRFSILLKSGRLIILDLTLDSKKRVEEIRHTFTQHLTNTSQNTPLPSDEHESESQKES